MMRILGTAPRRLGFIVAALAIVLDQASKAFLLFAGPQFANCAPCRTGSGVCHICEPIALLPVLNLTMVWNRGVSFGLFPADSLGGRLFLIVFSLLVVVGLTVWLWRARGVLVPLGIGLVIGGALGNVIDRARFGAVADFFHFHAFGYDWYVFNVADAAIVVGVAVLIYESVFGERSGQQAQARGSSDYGK